MRLGTVMSLGFLAQSFQLRRLDRGIRQTVAVNKQQLRSQQRLVQVQQQGNQLLQQMNQMQRQQGELMRQSNQLAAQQLAVQIAQLQTQRQQLEVQYHQLELDLQREEAAAIENELLRRFVDLHEAVKNAIYGAMYYDALTLITASERVYAQLYPSLQDANNRITISTLRDQSLEALRRLMMKEEALLAVASTITAGLGPYREVVASRHLARAELDALNQDAPAATTITSDLAELQRIMTVNREYHAKFVAVRQRFVDVSSHRANLPDDTMFGEFLFVVTAAVQLDVVRPYHQQLEEVRTCVEAELGMPLDEVAQGVQQLAQVVAADVGGAEGSAAHLDRALRCQRLVVELSALVAWEEDVRVAVEEVGDPPEAPGSAAEPAQEAVHRYVSVMVGAKRAALLATLGRDARERNRGVLDPAFPEKLQGLVGSVRDESARLVPWAVGVTNGLAALADQLDEISSRWSSTARSATAWRKETDDDETRGVSLLAVLRASLDGAAWEQVEEAAAKQGKHIGSRLLSAVSTGRSKQRAVRARQIEAALAALVGVHEDERLPVGGAPEIASI